jgi:hypothetical protein
MRFTHPLVVLATALLVVVGSTPAFALAPDAVGGGEVRAQADEPASATFEDGNVSVARGDELNFSVSHSDAATVSVGSDENGFNLTLELGGSGTDEVTIRTYETANAPASAFVEGGGTATLQTEQLEEPLKPGDYLMRVTVGGVERDLATLTVEPREEMSASAFLAPRQFSVTEYTAAADDAEVGPLVEAATNRSSVAVKQRRPYGGDFAVVELDERSLETALNVDDVSGGADANGVKLNFTQKNPGPNSDPREFVADAADGDAEVANVTVLQAFGDDTVYFLWNTSGVTLSDHPERNEYLAQVTLVGETNDLVSEDTVVARTNVSLRSDEVSLEPSNDSVHFPWETPQFRVEGDTNRAPNTDLEVRLKSTDPNAFLEIQRATVGPNGTYSASFDLSGLSRGTNATLWVRGYFLQTAQEVRLVAPDPSVRLEDQTANGTTLTAAHVEVPDGGFVRLEDLAGEPVGRSEYLPAGRHDDVNLTLSMPLYQERTLRAELVRDADANASYLRNGSVVNDTARVSFPAAPTETATERVATRTATQTATPAPTTSPYPVRTETPLAPADSSASQSSVPLPLSVPVAAVLVAGLLFATRRRRER